MLMPSAATAERIDAMASKTQSGQPDFGTLLRHARRAAGFTQEELAERANVSVRGISDIERGVFRAPHKDTLDLLADALGLPDEERAVWERTRRRLSSRATTAASRPTAQRSPTVRLPTPLTTLIGREREVAAIVARLNDPAVRLLTLTGPGGIGKTRLAIAAARAVSNDVPDGVVFVDLAPLGSPNLVIPTIAARLNLHESGNEPILEVLTAHLAERRILLVLDNVEHVLDAAPAIAALLRAAPSLTILATSRIALRVSGEHLYDVPTLDVPDPASAPDLASAMRHEAVRLFIERAGLVLPESAFTDANAANIAAICRRLDGLPLAIELAASRVRSLPPAAMLERLDRSLPLLTSGPRDLPARQRTLRDTIGWSHSLLSDDERRLFRRLSVFRGGWTLEAAEGIAGNDCELDVPDLLDRLVEQSLIRATAQSDGAARYTMLETIREFALEQLAAAGEADETNQRHCDYFVSLADRGDYALHRRPEGAASDEWFDRFVTEHDNFRAALNWTRATDNPDVGFTLIGLLWYFLSNAGHYSEGRYWTDNFLPIVQIVPCRSHIRALTVSGLDAHYRGNDEEGARRLNQAIELARSIGSEDMAAPALLFHGILAAEKQPPDLEAADAFFEQARTSAQSSGNWRAVIIATGNRGTIASFRGDQDQAVKFMEASLALARDTDDFLYIIMPLVHLSEFAVERGDLEQAETYYHEAFRLPAISRRVNETIQAIEGLADLTRHQGRFEITVRLMSAAARARSSTDFRMTATYEAELAAIVQAARESLDEESFASAWNEGAAMSLDQAIDFARLVTDTDVEPSLERETQA